MSGDAPEGMGDGTSQGGSYKQLGTKDGVERSLNGQLSEGRGLHE